MHLSFLKATALTLLQALAVRSNEDALASAGAVGDVAAGAARLTAENNGLNGCLDDCDRNRGGQGNNGWEVCRARCEADFGIGRRRSGRGRIDDWDSDRAQDRRSDRIGRRSNNRSQRRSDRQNRIDKYGTLTTSFDGDRARGRRNDRINRRSNARNDRRKDRRSRNRRPPVAPTEEEARAEEEKARSEEENVPASDEVSQDVATDAILVEAENNGLNGCLDDCDRNRGGQGNNGWEVCRARCEADFGIGRRRSGRGRIDDWDSDRAQDRRSDRIGRRSNNRSQRRSDRQNRIDKYGTLTTSFDGDRARGRRNDRINRRSNNRSQRRSDRRNRINKYGTLTTSFDGDRARGRRNDRINRRSNARNDRRKDRRSRNRRPPVAPAEEADPLDEVAPASDKDSQNVAVE